MSSPPYAAKKRPGEFNIWATGSPLLGYLDIELTERCNNNCIHCCINRAEKDADAMERELSTEGLKRILTEAASLGVLSVRFTGGEPLLRNDFEELYLFTRRLGLKVMLFTNARLITPRLVELFSKIPPLELIEVSVYGMARRSYEAVSRSEGSYSEFKIGIDLLLKYNIPFIVKGALLPPNRNDLDEFESWAKTIRWMQKKPSYSMAFNLRERKISSKSNSLIKKLRILPQDYIAVLARDRHAYLNNLSHFCNNFIGPPGDRLFTCGAGDKPCVDAYGNLQPCISLRHPDTVYPLEDGNIRDAITKFFPAVRELRATNTDYLSRCARCFLKGLCEQCPAKSWSEHGTLDTPVEYFCQIAHAQAMDLGILKKHENGWKVKNWKQRVIKYGETKS